MPKASRRERLFHVSETSASAFRALPSLWELHDAVAASTLVFSMIRMRNAEPRPG